MKKALLPVLITLYFVVLSCGTGKKMTQEKAQEEVAEKEQPAFQPADGAHNSQNSLDWPGQYSGVLPCADCEGIEVNLAIQEDGAYFRSLYYIGKSPDPVMQRGKFQWNTTGNYIRLRLPNGSVQWYQVGENVLYHLDSEGKRIEGDLADKYILKKETGDAEIEDLRWYLTEMNGELIEEGAAMRLPNLSLNSVRKTVSGNDGCNSYSGNYNIPRKGKISFGAIASTEMYCEEDELSGDYYEALARVDEYFVEGNILVLAEGSTPLLKFRSSEGEESPHDY